MFHTLFLNALETSPEEHEVVVSVEYDGFFKITIHNNGFVPDELRETFCQKFSTHGKAKGTGLGLYIAKLVVDMHQGSIAYRSSEEHGSEITILLPRQILSA